LEVGPGVVLAQRYKVQRPLGRGGMGEVFAAENLRTGRVVAVKVLRADSKQKSSAVERFRREARAAGSINSDHVTQVLDVDDDPEHGILIIFELLEGESLIDRLKRTGPMSFEELFPIVEQVLMGLSDAHRAGIIHRDLKPSNVFLERRPDGSYRVKILDFGISKLPKEVAGDTLTEMGQSLGTFSFMPPEQIGKAKTVDHRADIYATATLIFQSLSGQLPYAAKNILHMVELKSKSEPRPLGSVLEGGVDPALEAFLSRSLAREPNDRFPTAADALDAWRALRNAHVGPVRTAPAQTEVPTAAEGARRAPAPQFASTMPSMVSASSSVAPSPAPVVSGAMHSAPGGYPAPGGPAVPARNATLSGTMMMMGSPSVTGSRHGIPNVAPDTTSEGGDHSETLAMPRPAAARTLSSVPRLHEDAPESAGHGTQLMANPNSPRVPVMGPPSMAGPGYGMPAAALRTGGYAPHPGPTYDAQPPSGEEGLTSVYRREGDPSTSNPTTGNRKAFSAPASSRGTGSSVGLFLGVLVFALVGFSLAALVLSYAQTGRWLWQ
jgi:serine/threonine protein kinase